MKGPRAGYASAIALVAALVTSLVTPAPAAKKTDGFKAEVSRIPPDVKERMIGNSWHKGCPVPLRHLRFIRVSYNGFDGEAHMGRLIVHKDAVKAMLEALRAMYRNDFKIRKMWLADRYDSDDRRMIRADNTSAFNCRFVSGTTRWSQHAYGRAIDINPVENPYVSSDGSVRPRKGKPYKDRSRHRKGMIHTGGKTVRAFERQGWGWGGYWSSAKDYMHFSASGT